MEHAEGTTGTSDSPNGELTLADLENEFGWLCWHDSGQYYARHPLTPADDHDAWGDDPADLREAILLALSHTPTGR